MGDLGFWREEWGGNRGRRDAFWVRDCGRAGLCGVRSGEFEFEWRRWDRRSWRFGEDAIPLVKHPLGLVRHSLKEGGGLRVAYVRTSRRRVRGLGVLAVAVVSLPQLFDKFGP